MKATSNRQSSNGPETNITELLCDCGNPKCCKCELEDMNQLSRKASSSRASSSTQRKKTPNDFQQMAQTLGQGSFGWVTLVKEILTGRLFAMKTIRKAELFKYCTIDNLKREIKIQRKLNHPHIIKLDSYFEDKQNVYLILEYAEGGSLFKLIKKKRKLTEDEAFLHLYQTCLGIDYLHKQKIVHRDLKPENILLDSRGNIKICDFGWSTEMTNLKRAFCGTIEYMAPEMIRSQTTNYKLDIWCLGVLLYEMNDQEKCNAILSGKALKYDEAISEECRSLITTILQQNPFGRPTISQIFSHQWMTQQSRRLNINLYDFATETTPTSRSMSETTIKNSIGYPNPCSAPYQAQKLKTMTSSCSSYRDYRDYRDYLSPEKTPESFNSEKNVQQQKLRGQQFIFNPPLPRQQEEMGICKRILVALGCIQR